MSASPTTQRPASVHPFVEPEAAYDDVSLGEGWGFVSLAFFFASLATRPILSALPFEYRGWDQIPPRAVTLVPVFALLGLVCAFIGRRRGAIPRLALLLNAAVLALSSLLILALLIWRFSRG